MISLAGSLAFNTDLGLGIYNGLFHSTVTIQTTDLFIHFIGAMGLLLTGFSPSDLLLPVVPFDTMSAGVQDYLAADSFYSYSICALPGLYLKKPGINLDQAEKEFTSIENKFKSDSSPSGHPHEEKDKTNPENFQLFINGLYQAEGITGVYFPVQDSLRVVFYFSIGQNYSPTAAILFLRLQAILGIGNIKIVLNKSGIPHIRYVVYNTKEVLDKIVPYFSFLYGQKRSDLAKLHRIFDLSKALSGKGGTLDVALASELIHLVYSTNPKGQERKIALTEKLSIFNCSREDPAFRDEIAVENVDLPSKFFIIGLFLGDGSIGFVFDEPKSRAPKFYIKIVFNFASQSANDANIYLLTLIAKSMGLAPNICIKKVSMVTLDYSGETVFKEILPFLEEHREWLY